MTDEFFAFLCLSGSFNKILSTAFPMLLFRITKIRYGTCDVYNNVYVKNVDLTYLDFLGT